MHIVNSVIDRAKILDELLELTWTLSKPMRLEQALQSVTDTALRVLPGDHTSVRLLDRSKSELISWARSGTGASSPPMAFRQGQGVAGWVCRSGRAAIVDDVEDDKRFVRNDKMGVTVRSLLAVPLLAAGEVVGVLATTAPTTAAFTIRDEGIARLLANAAVPLIDKVRLQRMSVPPRLEHALESPLRLRLVAELLEAGKRGLSLDEAVVRSGRHRKDVDACLRPMLAWGVLAEADGAFKFRPDLADDVRQTLEQAVAKRADELGREQHVRDHLLGGMIGLDPKMQVVFEAIRQVARIDVPVNISGETGTGKELVARAIHDSSPRRGGFFGAVNCGTLNESLFDSQVFGHMRGAFTGAIQDYVGLAERCHGGTLFLDEVGELSPPNQVKLLRLLQENTFTRVGETSPRRSDFRLVSATNRDLSALVKSGVFREDLYYRLCVFPIRIPSLRERMGDLRYLVDGILAMQSRRFMTGGDPPTVTAEAMAQLERYHWPGNVRELENVMARAVVMAGGAPIGREHLHEVELLSDRPRDSSMPPDDTGEFAPLSSLDDIQRDHIRRTLRQQRGNIKATATILNISRTTLYKKIRDYGIDAPL